MRPAAMRPSLSSKSSWRIAVPVTMPDGVAQTETTGISSNPATSDAWINPPNAELVPRSRSRIESPHARPERSNAARSVRTELNTLVSCDIWAAAIRSGTKLILNRRLRGKRRTDAEHSARVVRGGNRPPDFARDPDKPLDKLRVARGELALMVVDVVLE